VEDTVSEHVEIGVPATPIPSRGERIVFARDAFDAMVSARPYREQVGPAEAIRGATALRRIAA